MDAKEIGIKLQGSLRPLIARAEDLSWACSEEYTRADAAEAQPSSLAEADRLGVMGCEKPDDISSNDVVVSFKLQPGSYALEAMRELMKQP